MKQKTADLTMMLPPGDQLRKKRIEFGLGIEDVAQELFLSSNQMSALEANDYENLPGPTYIVGYWRSYANLLNIDIGPAIELHKKELTESASGIRLEPNHQRAHGHQEKSRKRSAVLFFLLSVAFLCVLWYWQNPDENPVNQWVENLSNNALNARNQLETPELETTGSGEWTNAANNTSDQIVQIEITPEVEPILPEPVFSDEFENSNQSGDTSESSVILDSPSDSDLLGDDSEPTQDEFIVSETMMPEGDEEVVSVVSIEPVEESSEVNEQIDTVVAEDNALPTVESISANSTQQYEIPDAESSDGQSIEQPLTESTVQNTAIATALSALENETQPQFDVASANWLILEISEQTWLDVRDKTGEKLIYRTVEAGNTIELQGEPPFAIFIGSSTGVDVEYLGKPVEFEAHSSGLFARFLVGQQ